MLIFHVCTRGRTCPKRRSCDVAEALREAIVEFDAVAKAVVVEEACLCLCRTGPTVVFMPGNHQYGHVQPADCRELVESHVRLQQPLRRLLAVGSA
ncbi:MAG: (2Fe-2S) ferredoxin domain-containing protein [Candidatus Obscuribacterales bacterium]|nr:(2Fe-2S) ferredoxin domain-containing protein [Candidatus Obscuribacterales bacterium]